LDLVAALFSKGVGSMKQTTNAMDKAEDRISLKDLLARMGSEVGYAVSPYKEEDEAISLIIGNCQCIIHITGTQCDFEFRAVTNHNWAARYRTWSMATHYSLDLASQESMEFIKQLFCTQAALYNNIGALISDLTAVKQQLNQQLRVTKHVFKKIAEKFDKLEAGTLDTGHIDSIRDLPVD
jgi:hypothetical protein